jgi:hypothetical protein
MVDCRWTLSRLILGNFCFLPVSKITSSSKRIWPLPAALNADCIDQLITDASSSGYRGKNIFTYPF